MKIIFLDRDGVINKYPGDYEYVSTLKEFRFIRGSKKAIACLYDAGFKIFVISNQAGVTKGIYTRKTLDEITNKMLKNIKKYGGDIEGIFYCIHTDRQNCSCRKPKTGLIDKAIHKLKPIDIKNYFLVGDSIRDMETGRNAGCKTMLVLSGKEKKENRQNWAVQPDFIAKNLLEAVKTIINKK